jgi:hypothetical protein
MDESYGWYLGVDDGEDEDNKRDFKNIIVVAFLLLKIELDNIGILILKMQQHICMVCLINCSSTGSGTNLNFYNGLRQSRLVVSADQ